MFIFSLRAFVALFIFLGVASVYAHNKVVVIPLEGDSAPPTPIEYAIGDTGPAGGIVFHVTNGGLNGLEAAPVDQTEGVPWNCQQTDLPGLFNVGFPTPPPDSNSGALNTPVMAIQCPGIETNAAVHAAAYVWPNGQRDGFLPNIDELNLLYDQKGVVGGFTNIYYWSSSEHDLFSAWEVNFFDGTNLRNVKDGVDRVRAIRLF